MAVSQPAYDPFYEGKRADARLRLHLPARLILATRSSPCVLENVSRTGARLVVERPPHLAEFGQIRSEFLDHFFETVWRDGNRVGIAFDEPLSGRILVGLREMHDNFPDLQRRAVRALARHWVTGEQD